MMFKSLAAAGLSATLIAFAFVASTENARAGGGISIDLGIGDACVGEDCDDDGPDGDDDDDDDDDGGRVSCQQAGRMLRNRGWYRVRAVNCSGKRYRFTAWRKGDKYLISVSAWRGRILSVNQLD
jgi:hypothetical protein